VRWPTGLILVLTGVLDPGAEFPDRAVSRRGHRLYQLRRGPWRVRGALVNRLLKDATGSYSYGLLMLAALVVAGGVLVLSIKHDIVLEHAPEHRFRIWHSNHRWTD
jgi:hypothetical protein